MTNLGVWPLVITILGLLIAALSSAFTAALMLGAMREKIRALEEAKTAHAAKMDAMQQQLSRGDSSFVELRTLFAGVSRTLDEIKHDIEQLISRRPG